MGNWIQVNELNWIQFIKYEYRWIEPNLLAVNLTWVESTGSAGRVEFELSRALWKAVMMNLSWVFTQSTWILSESESTIYQTESKNRVHFTITIHHFLSQGGAHGNSLLDIMKEAVAGSFCISTCTSIVNSTHKSPTRYIIKSEFQYYHMYQKCTGFWQ